MPESPHDDRFADLFGNLPDPRDRPLRSAGSDADRGSAPEEPARPLSRREAEEERESHQALTSALATSEISSRLRRWR